MRFDVSGSAFRLLTNSLFLFAAIIHCPAARAQIIPTPGFPYDTYKISSSTSVHFCRLTDSELIYAEKSHDSTKLVSRNYTTGVEAEFDQANALLAAAPTLPASEVHVSQDGKWAAWPASIGEKQGVSVTKLAGKQHRFIEIPEVRVISWAPEPDTIICFSADGPTYSRLGYYNMETGVLDSDFHIAKRSGFAGLADDKGHRILVCFCPLSDHKAWTVTMPYAYKTGSSRFGLGGAALFEMYELSNTALARTGYAINLPAKCDLVRAVVSPHQKYVIWELGFQSTTELWLSDMNGLHLRRAVTMLEDKYASYSDADPPIADIMWLPSGPKIGCRVGGVLYVVHLDIDKDQPEP